MIINLGILIQKLDYFLGVKFFNIPKFFSYSLLDKFLEKSISKQLLSNNFLKKFHEIGFVKIKNSDLTKVVDNIIDQIKDQKIELITGESSFFKINHTTYLLIKDLLNINLNEYLKNLSRYFRGGIYLTELALQRNSETSRLIMDKSLNKLVPMKGSDTNFHLDHYLSNYFKIFIHLSDVDENCGPTEIIPKNMTKDYIDRTGYKNIYKEQTKINCENVEYVFKNTGAKGDALFMRTANCLHRAGLIKTGHLRDTIQMTFVVDFENSNNDYFYLFDPLNNKIGEKHTKDLAKPKNFQTTYNLYKRVRKKLSIN